jgi:hypothetical protein
MLEMGKNLFEQVKLRTKSFCYYVFVADGSNDIRENLFVALTSPAC